MRMWFASDLESRPQRIVVLFTSSTLRFLHRPATTDMQKTLPVMPDDHSELVPPLPIPNRTVKRFRADDSAATSVKVGYRQACYTQTPVSSFWRGFLLCAPGFDMSIEGRLLRMLLARV